MARNAPEDSAIWRVVAVHVDTREKLEVLRYLAADPRRAHSQRDLAAHVHADQLTLLELLRDLQGAGLVQAVRSPSGLCYRLTPTGAVSHLVSCLPAYYARSRR
jgi:DNA-binding MarR family transcriptional regulator